MCLGGFGDDCFQEWLSVDEKGLGKGENQEVLMVACGIEGGVGTCS